MAVTFTCAAIMVLLWTADRARSQSSAGDPATAAPLQDTDAQCAGCHAAIYKSYEQTSMAGGSGRAAEAITVGSFTHAPSGVTYRVGVSRGKPTLSSVRAGVSAPLNDTEELVYFIGSGKHGRTYLFSRPLPEYDAKLWYETPVNWYTRRAGYGMAPAYDNAAVAPLALPTDAGCLHCHATAVQQPLSTAPNAFRGQPFLQGGIGCSACHGDPGAHLRSNGKMPMLRIRDLSPSRRDSICLQCHLEGDAMVQRAGRRLSSFLPGQDLGETAIYFVNSSSAKSALRASSQYEGLLRSACRRAVGDKLTCTTCHSPHSAPAPERRVAFFRAKCLQCHSDSPQFHPATHHPEQQDCAACHMPSRTTSDISHEQNADHDIEVRHNAADVTPAPLLRSLGDASRYTHAVTLVPLGGFKVSNRELGLAYAQFAARGDQESYLHALDLLRKTERDGQADAVVHEQLGFLAQLGHDNALARREYEAALALNPEDNTALANLAVLEAQGGDLGNAVRHLSRVDQNDPAQTSALLNLALIDCRRGEVDAAKRLLQRALAFNPDNPDARRFLNTGNYAGVRCEVR